MLTFKYLWFLQNLDTPEPYREEMRRERALWLKDADSNKTQLDSNDMIILEEIADTDKSPQQTEVESPPESDSDVDIIENTQSQVIQQQRSVSDARASSVREPLININNKNSQTVFENVFEMTRQDGSNVEISSEVVSIIIIIQGLLGNDIIGQAILKQGKLLTDRARTIVLDRIVVYLNSIDAKLVNFIICMVVH